MSKPTFKVDKELDGKVVVSSNLFNPEEAEFIKNLILEEKQTDDVLKLLCEQYPKYAPMKIVKLRGHINAIKTQMLRERDVEWLMKNKSTVNTSIEEQEKKLFQGVFNNVQHIEEIKKISLAKLFKKSHRVGLGPRALKDLTVIQAIGLRDLRDYKSKRAGKLANWSDTELAEAKDKIVKYFMVKKGGKTLEIKTTETLPENKERDDAAPEGNVPAVVEVVESRIVPEAGEAQDPGQSEIEESFTGDV